MLNRSDAKPNAGVTGYPWRLRMSRIGRGQSTVEFAMIAVLAITIMLVGVQYALIGQAALAVSQGSSAIARYAAVNPGTVGGTSGNSAVTLNGSAEQQLLSSSICGGTCGNLTASITSISATTGTANTTANPPAFGDRLTVILSYDARSKIVLPNQFFGIPLFPTTLSASDSQMYE